MTEHKETECSRCGYTLSASTIADGEHEPPQEDDFSICFGCGLIYRFTADLGLREATRDDINGLREKQPDDYELLKNAQKWVIEKNVLNR